MRNRGLAHCSNWLTMKRFLENSSSGSDDDDVFEAFQPKRKQENSSEDEDDENHKQFKKVDVNLKNYVYEPVHFVRAHCKAGEMPQVDTQVNLSLKLIMFVKKCAYLKF